MIISNFSLQTIPSLFVLRCRWAGPSVDHMLPWPRSSGPRNDQNKVKWMVATCFRSTAATSVPSPHSSGAISSFCTLGKRGFTHALRSFWQTRKSQTLTVPRPAYFSRLSCTHFASHPPPQFHKMKFIGAIDQVFSPIGTWLMVGNVVDEVHHFQ